MRRFWKKDDHAGLPFFVSIGAGLNQIPLIREAKKLGFHVIGVDTNPNAPGFFKCDLKIQESILNHNEIYMKLQELLVDGDIRSIMTKSFGPAIMTTAFLAEKFRIPFVPYATCGAFIDKGLMKSIFEEHGILTSRVVDNGGHIRKEKFTSAELPLVFKPNTGHAKKGVRLIKTMSEMNSQLKEAARTKNSYMIEEFIQGDEIIALGIVHKKEFHLVDITDKVTTPPPYFVDLKHIAPSAHEDLFTQVQNIGQKVAQAFMIDTSPMVMEFIVTGNKELYLIEAVPEFGGEFLADVLVPSRTGYNFISETIKACTGTGFRPPAQRKNRKATVVQYITGKKGTLASCNPDGPAKVPGILFSRIFKEIGAEVQEPSNNHDRIGMVAVEAKTVEEALDRSQQAIESFNVRIKI